MVEQTEIKITGEPLPIPSMCRFVVDRPVYANRSYFFGSREAAERSPLAKRLFAIDGVQAVLIAHDCITVTKEGFEPWPVVGKQIGAAIREHLASGEPAVDEELWQSLPPADEIRQRVEKILNEELNPALAMHGGFVRLVDVKDNVVMLELGGGCQGCGMAVVTLKQGVEQAIRAQVPEVGEIIDVTDHAAGRNPYYADGP